MLNSITSGLHYLLSIVETFGMALDLVMGMPSAIADYLSALPLFLLPVCSLSAVVSGALFVVNR